MFTDDTPAGAAYIVTNDKGEKVFWLPMTSSECIVILFAGFYSSPRPRIPRLGCRFRSRVNCVSQLGVAANRFRSPLQGCQCSPGWCSRVGRVAATVRDVLMTPHDFVS